MHEIIIVTLAAIIGAISPGPDFAIVSRNSIVYTRKIGIFTALGIGLGTLLHASYSIIGLGLIIAQSILVFNLLKLGGAAYLMYLGIKMLRAKRLKAGNKNGAATLKIITNWQALKIGFLTSITNPKVTLFFLSIFSQIISPTSTLNLKIFYGLEISFIVFAWFALVATVFTIKQVKARYQRYVIYLEKIFGALLISLGLKIVFARE
ncbi:MAG: LysE family transporter [Patescibacteria group bacterium]